MERNRLGLIVAHVRRPARIIDGVPHVYVADAVRAAVASNDYEPSYSMGGDFEAGVGGGFALRDIGERRVRTRERGSVVRPKAATRTRPQTR